MSNSGLVKYTRISPNQSGARNHAIDTITIHCVVGQCAIESLGNLFANPSIQASSNYGIGYDGKIGMFVEEKDRSWCTSSASNDNRAITIECASDAYEPYAVNSAVYASLLNLVTDICKRNGIKKLVWSTDRNTRMNHLNGCNMTVHRDYANKSCPGKYLYDRMGEIAAEVNKRLGSVAPAPTPTPAPKPTPTPTASFKAGDVVKIVAGAKYTNGKVIPDAIIDETWIVKSVTGTKALIDKSIDGKWSINSTINVKYLKLVKNSDKVLAPYIVRVTASALNIRSGPGTTYNIVGTIVGAAAFTIVAESRGQGATMWGKLKSGAGWIALDYTKKI